MSSNRVFLVIKTDISILLLDYEGIQKLSIKQLKRVEKSELSFSGVLKLKTKWFMCKMQTL